MGSTNSSATQMSAAVQDLGLGSDLMQQTQDQIEEMKRKQKLQGNINMSPAVMALTGVGNY